MTKIKKNKNKKRKAAARKPVTKKTTVPAVKKDRPTISLCFIARDEEHYIRRCIESFGDIYDELIVVDTGSVDRTVEIAKELGARVEHFEWISDFAAARNFAKEQASCEWVLMPDADEYLAPEVNPQKIVDILRNIPEKVDNVLVEDRTLVDGKVVMTHYVNRLYRNLPEVKWRGRIHETLNVPLDKLAKAPEIYFFHENSKKRQPGLRLSKDRSDEYIKTLHLEAEENPESPRPLFYLANTYNEKQDYEKALEYYDRYFEISKWHEERAQACYNAAYAAKRLENLELSRQYLFKGMEANWQRAEIYLALGDISFQLKNWPEALHWFMTAARCKRPDTTLFLSEGAYKDEPWFKLSRTHLEMGNGEDAIFCARRALELSGEDPKRKKNLEELEAMLPALKEVTVIVPSKNPELVDRCLQSIYASENKTPYGVLVVVDGEADDFKSLAGKYPDVGFLRGVKPFVYSRNINMGIQACSQDVILLNDDTVIETDGWIDKLRQIARYRPNHGIVSPLISKVGNPRQRWENQKECDAEEEPSNLMFVCVYVTRELIDKIGLLDESYVWYGFEDNDYCVRAKMHGFKLLVSHKTKVRHDEPHSSFKTDVDVPKSQMRAQKYFMSKFRQTPFQATVLYFTWNRLDYTKRTLPRLLDSVGKEVRVVVFDNNSDQETLDYLRGVDDSRVQLYLNNANAGLSQPTNFIYKGVNTEFVAKVDNDTLVPDGWLDKFIEAHETWGDELGVVSGFHFMEEDWDPEAEKNIIERNGIKMLQQPHVGGCCYVMRRKTFLECGDIPAKSLIGGWTEYQHKQMNEANKYVGYLYPLVYVQHLDDPRHPETGIDPDYLWQTRRLTMEQCADWYRRDAKNLLTSDWAKKNG